MTGVAGSTGLTVPGTGGRYTLPGTSWGVLDMRACRSVGRGGGAILVGEPTLSPSFTLLAGSGYKGPVKGG